MSKEERIIMEDCGCHYDRKTGVCTCYCEEHDPDGMIRRIKYLEERVIWLENLIYDRTRT